MINVPIDRIVPLTDARDNFSRLVADLENQPEGMYVLTKGGKPAIALININFLAKVMGDDKANVATNTKPAVKQEKIEPPKAPLPNIPSFEPPKAAAETPMTVSSVPAKPTINPSWTGTAPSIPAGSRTTPPTPNLAPNPPLPPKPVNPWPITPPPVSAAAIAPTVLPINQPISPSPLRPNPIPPAPPPPPPAPPKPVAPAVAIPTPPPTQPATPTPPPPPVVQPPAPVAPPVAPAPTVTVNDLPPPPANPTTILFDEPPKTNPDPGDELPPVKSAIPAPPASPVPPTAPTTPGAPAATVKDIEI